MASDANWLTNMRTSENARRIAKGQTYWPGRPVKTQEKGQPLALYNIMLLMIK